MDFVEVVQYFGIALLIVLVGLACSIFALWAVWMCTRRNDEFDG